MQFNTGYYLKHKPDAGQAFRKLSGKNYYELNEERHGKVLAIWINIFREFSVKHDSYRALIQANMDILFIELLRQSRDTKSKPDEKKLYAQEKPEEFHEYLQSNITTTKQVSQYTAKLYLTPYHLNAITRETMGKTSSELINEHIILEAKRQLPATNNQITRIARDLGYEDYSYFIRNFKKHTGHTPEIFRKNFK